MRLGLNSFKPNLVINYGIIKRVVFCSAYQPVLHFMQKKILLRHKFALYPAHRKVSFEYKITETKEDKKLPSPNAAINNGETE